MLKDEIIDLKGKAKEFIIYRVAGADVQLAMKLVDVKKASYSSWCKNKLFVEINRQCKEFQAQYQDEALRMLRKDNQLAACLMEAEVISQVRVEIQSGELSLAKTPLAREVYARLVGEMDKTPTTAVLNWEQFILERKGLDNPLQLVESTDAKENVAEGFKEART